MKSLLVLRGMKELERISDGADNSGAGGVVSPAEAGSQPNGGRMEAELKLGTT